MLQLIVPGVMFFAMCTAPDLSSFALRNLAVQLAIFIPFVHIPAQLTGRMSYVDIGWPAGLVAIGVQAFFLNSTLRLRTIGVAFIVQGGRMLLWGIRLYLQGHLDEELPRYKFQHRRWAKRGIEAGSSRFTFTMHVEILIQAAANFGILVLPAAIQTGPWAEVAGLSPLEYAGYCLWLASLTFEHVADVQKAAFVADCESRGLKGACCEIGLWKFCRHPNYFGEWMVWVSLAVVSLPSVANMWQLATHPWPTSAALTFGLVVCVHAMFVCLTTYTGAVPSEYYSAQKRPSYVDYQRRVPMFFPTFLGGRPLAHTQEACKEN